MSSRTLKNETNVRTVQTLQTYLADAVIEHHWSNDYEQRDVSLEAQAGACRGLKAWCELIAYEGLKSMKA
jgi:hypothetical protein